jgi:hypothetical protein
VRAAPVPCSKRSLWCIHGLAVGGTYNEAHVLVLARHHLQPSHAWTRAPVNTRMHRVHLGPTTPVTAAAVTIATVAELQLSKAAAQTR